MTTNSIADFADLRLLLAATPPVETDRVSCTIAGQDASIQVVKLGIPCYLLLVMFEGLKEIFSTYQRVEGKWEVVERIKNTRRHDDATRND